MSWSCADSAGAHIDDEDDRVGLGDRLLASGAPSRWTMPVGFSGSKPPVSTTMNSCPPTAAVAVVAVARQAGEVGDDRVARLRQRLNKRRLADVGPADQRDDGLHGCRRAGAMQAQLRRGGTRTRRPSA